jgi:hypothetical protein
MQDDVQDELAKPTPRGSAAAIPFATDRELIEALLQIVELRLASLRAGSPPPAPPGGAVDPFFGALQQPEPPEPDYERAATLLARGRVLQHQVEGRLAAGDGGSVLALGFRRWMLSSADILIVAVALGLELAPGLAEQIGELTALRAAELLGGGVWAPLEIEAFLGARSRLVGLAIVEVEPRAPWRSSPVRLAPRVLALARGELEWSCPVAELAAPEPPGAVAIEAAVVARLRERIETGSGVIDLRAAPPGGLLDARVAAARGCHAAGCQLAVAGALTERQAAELAREARLHGAAVFAPGEAAAAAPAVARWVPVLVSRPGRDPAGAGLWIPVPSAADRRRVIDAELATLIGPRGRALISRLPVTAAALARACSALSQSSGASLAEIGLAVVREGDPDLAARLRRPRHSLAEITAASATLERVREAARAVRAHWSRALATGEPAGLTIGISGADAATAAAIGEGLAAELELAMWTGAAVAAAWSLPFAVVAGAAPAAVEAVAVAAGEGDVTIAVAPLEVTERAAVAARLLGEELAARLDLDSLAGEITGDVGALRLACRRLALESPALDDLALAGRFRELAAG